MTFAEKLKFIRKQFGLSQEQLAQKIGVSRQAITKWETNMGIPDIENIMAISTLFNISIDELLSHDRNIKKQTDYLYESIIEYDIDCIKHYDLKLGGANTVILSQYDGEKIRIRLTSDTIKTLQSDFKVKIDDVKNRIDVDIHRKNEMTEAIAKEGMIICVQIPHQYIGKIECEVHATYIEIQSLECDSIELDVKTSHLVLDNVQGKVEVNCPLDMDIVCKTLNGAVEINQISATSRLCVPEGVSFQTVKKGIHTSVIYERNGKQVEDFSASNADNVIEFNGMKSELVIYTSKL